jgi:dihydropteroate synthase
MLSSPTYSKSKVVRIINITPDSFSDGGIFLDEKNALLHLKKLLLEKADIIDVGAESTRPGAEKISASEELKRLEKIFPKIVDEIKKFNSRNNKNVLISLDSRRFEVIKKIFKFGIDIINDVSGLENKELIDFIAKKNLQAILMHSLSVPANPSLVIDEKLNVVEEILKFASGKIEILLKNGVKKSQIVFDPGIGFGKTAKQSIEILKNICSFKSLDIPIYIGHSRKSFLDFVNISDFSNEVFSAKKIFNREEKTKIISDYLMAKNVDYIRLH